MKYSLNQEVLINSLVKEKVKDLQQLLHDKKDILSDRQHEITSKELKQYQELLYRNRINRQL
ncbi:hypothetical protein FOC36_14120 [Enterococcus gallinarum]|uniref:hypothetical protein n=1 Tax=Enterococcus gallinarum TaxID=1353 RepID=UPI0012DEAD10|nr:hypothetical protein [Enterococcus gallinarum]QGR83242.1 hypothetical protein FOC36_14120 [Enterococcus gallinarum]